MAHTKHVTLVATTVATVTLDDTSQDKVYVTNKHATSEIYATVDGSTPTVGGDDTFLCPAARTTVLLTPSGATSVKLISSGTPTVTVSAHSPASA
jgi:hypothetical protein